MGPEDGDDKHVVILGRHVRWTAGGIEYEADPKHRKLIMEHFGFDEESSGLVFNGEKDWKKEEEWEEVLIGESGGDGFSWSRGAIGVVCIVLIQC